MQPQEPATNGTCFVSTVPPVHHLDVDHDAGRVSDSNWAQASVQLGAVAAAAWPCRVDVSVESERLSLEYGVVKSGDVFEIRFNPANLPAGRNFRLVVQVVNAGITCKSNSFAVTMLPQDADVSPDEETRARHAFCDLSDDDTDFGRRWYAHIFDE